MARVGRDEGKRFIDGPCSAHAMIDDVSLENGNSGVNLKCKFNVLAATDRNQVAKSMNEIFPLEGKGVSKLWDLLIAARIVPQGTDRNRELDFDESQLRGRQVCIKIHLEQGQSKNPVTAQWEDDPSKPQYPRLGFNAICDVYDPKAASVPKDPQFLSLWPALPDNGSASPPSAGQPAPTNPQPPTQPPASSGDQWSW